MRQTILIGLSVFAIVITGGVCITWFMQSVKTKHAIEESIAAFNAGPTKITYDGLKTSGFPLEMRVTLVRPHLHADMPSGQWSEEIALDGDLTLGVNAFSDHYLLAANGHWKRRSVVEGKTIAVEGKADGDIFFCTLHMKRGLQWLSAQLWDIENLQRNREQFFDDLRLFDCAAPGMHTVYDSQSGAVLMQNGPARFYINREPQYDGNRSRMRVYFNSGEIEVSPQGNDMLTMHAGPAANLHALGKMKTEIDLTYQGDPEFADGELIVDHLDFSAAPYGLTCHGNIKRQSDKYIPSGKLTVACTNCLRLVDDMADYVGRAQKTAQAMRPDMKAAKLPTEGFKTFLRALADAPADAGNDFTYTIVSDDATGESINGKPIEEVMQLYQRSMMPAAKKPAQ